MPRFLSVLLFLLAAGTAFPAPKAEPWPLWEAHDPASAAIVDHGAWGEFLATYLETGNDDGVNRLRYAEVSDADRRRLEEYITSLENTPVSRLRRNEQRAYWTNLYNAVTVALILDHYPVSSIRDIRISGPIYNRNPWDAGLVTVEGTRLSLNDIEHRILRPIWRDPRIHYVVNCASYGCPNLRKTPFTGENWEDLADVATADYVNHRRGIEITADSARFSSIYDWYVDDFGGSIAGVVEHAIEYADEATRRELESWRSSGYAPKVSYEYDWRLNEP